MTVETKVWDLIYVRDDAGASMTLVILEGHDIKKIGPFIASKAGPAIVKALVEHDVYDQESAKSYYMMRHFQYMNRGQNAAGQDYPMRSTTDNTRADRAGGLTDSGD